jgi:hypothetical protein
MRPRRRPESSAEAIATAAPPGGKAVMPDDPTSFTHAAFLSELELFEREFERFLTRPATPVEARRAGALETIRRLGAIGIRLRTQGVL